MSWGTHIRGDIFVDRLSFVNKKDAICQLESMIEDTEKYIKINKEELLILCSSQKGSNYDKDNSGKQFDYIENLRYKFNEIWEEIMDEKELLIKLKYTLDVVKNSKRIKIETY